MRLSDAFRKHCSNDIEKHERYLMTHGLMDGSRSLRLEVFRENFERIEPLWVPGVSAAVSAGSHFATIHECFGRSEKARQYHWLGSHEWNYHDIDYPVEASGTHVLRVESLADRMIRADDLVLQQLPAAICCDRAGDRGKAEKLFGWVALLRETRDEGYRQFIAAFAGGGHHDAWGRKTERAYALASLERWEEAHAESVGALEWIERGPRPTGDHAWRGHYWLLHALHALIRYRLEPTEKKLASAKAALRPRILGSQDHDRTLFLLFHFSHMRARNPELC